MNEEFKKIINSAKTVKLSALEKKTLFDKVDFYVGNNPAQNVAPVRRFHTIFSPYFMHTQKVVVFAFVAVLIFGGGTSLLAQSALPNSTLYPVKLTTESVRSWFAVGAKSKAYFETGRANERLKEAEKLAKNGQLDTASKDKIQKNFNKHVKNVQKQIETIEASNDLNTAVDVSKNFESSLRAHSESLSKITLTKDVEESISTSVIGREKVEARIMATEKMASTSALTSTSTSTASPSRR